MKSKFTLLILLAAVFASCKKTTNVDVKLSTSGKLTYRLTDDAGKGLPNVRVSLNDRIDMYSNYTILLDSKYTDLNGTVDFGDLNPRNYWIVADSPKVNNIDYNISEYVQVITGATKHKEVKVTDFSGIITVTAKSYYNNQLMKNIGVAVIPNGKLSYAISTASLLKLAHFSGVTNDAGSISFKVPSEKLYTLFFYNTSTNIPYSDINYTSTRKDATSYYTVTIY